MARRSIDSSSLPRPAVLASVGLLRKVVPLSAVKEVLAEKGRQSQRERMLPAQFLVYLVISLSLYMPYALREVLRCVMEGLRGLEYNLSESIGVSTKGAISRARTKLGYEVMASLFAKVARPMAVESTKGAWYRRWRLMGIDSTNLSLQHTPENEEAFGLPEGQNGNGAFPVLRVLGLVETGTHAVVAASFGGVNISSEMSLTEELVSSLGPGMLLLEDRGFIGYEWYKKVVATGADVLCRVRKNMKLPCIRRFDDGSYLSFLPPPKGDPGEPVPVRVIEYTLENVPGAEPLYRLITSILDPNEAPAKELAALYHERWEMEGLFDEFKTHIRGGNQVLLRSKTPDLVKQEVYGLLLAHYVVRSVMHDAALVSGEDPDKLSFIHAVRVLRRRLPQAAAVSFSPSHA
jgi:hypothetical protein